MQELLAVTHFHWFNIFWVPRNNVTVRLFELNNQLIHNHAWSAFFRASQVLMHAKKKKKKQEKKKQQANIKYIPRFTVNGAVSLAL